MRCTALVLLVRLRVGERELREGGAGLFCRPEMMLSGGRVCASREQLKLSPAALNLPIVAECLRWSGGCGVGRAREMM
jgi:hypothetical protein